MLIANAVEHLTIECSNTEFERSVLFQNILETLGADVNFEIINDSNESKFQKLIGKQLLSLTNTSYELQYALLVNV